MEILSESDWNELKRKAENGDVHAMNEVAFWLRQGLKLNKLEIVKVDKKSSFQWTLKAFERGDLEATEQYADYLTDKKNGVCEPNIELGIQLYEKCMKHGSKRAAFCLGLEYRNKQQFEKAFQYYQAAQNEENNFKELIIGQCYYYGIGVKKDKRKALEALKSVDIENCTGYERDEANYLIGRIYLEGEAVEQNLNKARTYLELADKDGDHRSAQELLILIGRTDLLNA